MQKYPSNKERTQIYLENFNREKTLKYIIDKEDLVIVDIGANIGSTALEFKQWWPKSQIHCFEPQVECLTDLNKIKDQYPLGEIIVNNKALGKEANGNAIFYTHKISSGLSGFNKINSNSLDSIDLAELPHLSNAQKEIYHKNINNVRNVELMRLDDYMHKNNIEHIDLIKIDTQGHEPEVLEGLGQMLSNIDVIISELMLYDYYERTLSFFDLEELLIPAGFKLYDISHIAKNPMNGRTDWVDVIYVNERIREKNNAQK